MPSPLVRRCRQRRRNALERCGKVFHDELRLEPEHAVAGAPQLVIPARVSLPALGVIAAVNFNRKLCRWRVEIYDEAEEHDLPPERNPEELASAQRPPELFLRGRGRAAIFVSESGEDVMASVQ